MSPKGAKASTIRVAVANIITGVIVLTFTNGNTALTIFYIGETYRHKCKQHLGAVGWLLHKTSYLN
jgi:hypothetical protein